MDEQLLSKTNKLGKNVRIDTLTAKDDIPLFLEAMGLICDWIQSPFRQLEKVLDLVGFPMTVVCENEYVDRFYRDAYYAYYASRHEPFARNCKRLSFFQGKIEWEKFYQYGADADTWLQDRFVGTCVVRPLTIGVVGRTLLDPAKIKMEPAYIRTTDFSCIILGHELKVNAFPFSSQDGAIMTCAETTVCNIIDYYSTRYPEYASILPSDILKELTESSCERVLPSRGLSYTQVPELLKDFGFAPRMYDLDNFVEKARFKRLFHYYQESGIPLAVGIVTEDGGHSVICVGHGKATKTPDEVKKFPVGPYGCIDTADLHDKYVIIDDNQHPYTIEEFTDMTIHGKSEIQMFVAPLYKRIFLEASDAEDFIKGFLTDANLGFGLGNFVQDFPEFAPDTKTPLMLRVFLTSSRKYRKCRAETSKNIAASMFYTSIHLPKFVWVGEISTYDSYEDGKIFGEIVLDATSGRLNPLEGLILVRYWNHLGYRFAEEGWQEVLARLQLQYLRLDARPYELYQNNLRTTEETSHG